MSVLVDRAQRTVWAAPFSVSPLSYEEAEALAHDTGFFGNTGDPLLETVEDMLDELGRPDEAYDIIQIAGTNGKTSTSRYTAAILQGEGLHCALYTSPELIEMRERMEIDRTAVSRDAFARGIALAAEAGRRVNNKRAETELTPYRVTEFDLLTVAACIIFAEAKVDVAVLEVGLGGRWDATSATRPVATCITGIGLDHVHILGDTLEAIAVEKAAVIKSGQACVLGVGTAISPSVEQIFLDKCREQKIVPTLVRPVDISDSPVGLYEGSVTAYCKLPHATYSVTRRPERLGAGMALCVTTPKATYQDVCAVKPIYQAANIACAITLAEAYLKHELNQYHLSEYIGECLTPGRFNVVQGSPIHIIDAAHNPQSVQALIRSLAEMESDIEKRPLLLCAVLADKDVEGIVALLAHEFPRIVVCATASARALAPHKLAKVFKECGVEPEAIYANVDQACNASKSESYLATGSITLAGEVAAWHQAHFATIEKEEVSERG